MVNFDRTKINHSNVQAHLDIIQTIIQRMSSNSTSCKSWCITLVSGILVITAGRNNQQLVLTAFMPTILFFFMDTYYLTLERMFRSSYDRFVKKFHNDELEASDFYVVSPCGNKFKEFILTIFSLSILPFYLFLVVFVYYFWQIK